MGGRCIGVVGSGFLTAATALFAPGGISGATLAYEERRRDRSDIGFFDLVTRRRFFPPAGVNTRRWSESEPSLSAQWLLFKRVARRQQLILLRNLRAGEQIVLAQAPAAIGGVDVGQINGDYAVWAVPGGIGRYDIARRTRNIMMALPEHRLFAPSVSARGVLYYAQ